MSLNEKLDGSLVGSNVYLRWEKYGWQLGKITAAIASAPPRLFKNITIASHGQSTGAKAKGGSKLAADKPRTMPAALTLGTTRGSFSHLHNRQA